MAIVNAGQLEVYDEIPAELRDAVEDVILNRRSDATERLLDIAPNYQGDGKAAAKEDLSWREQNVNKRLEHALVKALPTTSSKILKKRVNRLNARYMLLKVH